MNPFELVIIKLRDLGFYTFLLPFMLVAAIFYGLLRKSRVFGPPEKNMAINAVVSLTASFMVCSSPIIAGVNPEEELVKFFTHTMILTLGLIVAVMVGGMFLPEDLPKFINEKMKTKAGIFIALGLVLGMVLLITSGLTTVFLGETAGFGVSEDLILSIVTIVAMVAIIGLVVYFTGKEETKK